MQAPQLRLGEVVALLTLAQDGAFGQPPESQFRSCLLAARMCEALDVDDAVSDATYWVALLRYVGCTGHAHEVSALFGDEIALRARTLVHDAADPHEVVGDFLDFAASDPERRAAVEAVMAMGRDAFVPNFAAGCEVGDQLVARLGLHDDVRAALRCTFERWNGAGFPSGVAGDAIPLPMRIVHLTHDAEAIARIRSTGDAVGAVRGRSGRTYDPELAALFVDNGERWLADIERLDPWAAVLELEPVPRRTLDGEDLDAALTVIADFVDLKSPFMAGHSRRCADLAERAGALVGLGEDTLATLRRAALVHDVGMTSIPNSILDKPGPLTTAEMDRVRLHPLLTQQALRRSPALRAAASMAGAHHERADGTGYHTGVPLDPAHLPDSVLAATDVYVGATTERADRPAMTASEAADVVMRLADAGSLDGRAATAVLRAAGHRDGRRRATPVRPAGLTAREVEVLSLAAQGLTTRAIAERLFISPKTTDHHIQRVYTKIGVSSRGAAALWAMQHGLVG